MNNQISSARDVVKTHTMNVESFKCGTAGFLGTVDPDRLVYSRKPLRRQYVPIVDKQMPSVEIVMMYGGCDGTAVIAAVKRGGKRYRCTGSWAWQCERSRVRSHQRCCIRRRFSCHFLPRTQRTRGAVVWL